MQEVVGVLVMFLMRLPQSVDGQLIHLADALVVLQQGEREACVAFP